MTNMKETNVIYRHTEASWCHFSLRLEGHAVGALPDPVRAVLLGKWPPQRRDVVVQHGGNERKEDSDLAPPFQCSSRQMSEGKGATGLRMSHPSRQSKGG